MDEKKSNKWVAVLLSAGVLAVIALIVVIVMAVTSVKNQVDSAGKKADEAFAQVMQGDVPAEEVLPDGN